MVNVDIAKKSGEFFVSADVKGFIKFWDLKKGTCKTIKAHNKETNFIKISPNEKFLASGSHDKILKIYSSKKFQEIKMIKAHNRGIWDGEFNPNNN